MSDYSPLRLDNGNSPSQSSGDSRAYNATIQEPSDITRSQTFPASSHGRLRNHDRQRAATAEQSVDEVHNSHRFRSDSESSSKSHHLRYGAKNVIELFIPVSLCMLIVVGTLKATDSYRYSSQTVIWYAQVMFTDQTVDPTTRFWQSIANAFIMLALIVFMTTVLILLYKFRCYATIHAWLILSSLILLFMFATIYVAEILKVYNTPVDLYTLWLSIWNFGIVGMICIHWKGPLLLQQAYLITISAMLALVFIRSLPDWTTWTVLGSVSIWDLVAVLCPRGPLRILVETAQERNEPIFPALIYSSTMIWEVVTTTIVTTLPTITMAADDSPSPSQKARSRNDHKQSDRRAHRRARDNRTIRTDIAHSSPSRSRSDRGTTVSTPTKRNQPHPIDILYEGAAQAPEVEIIQPNSSWNSDIWPATAGIRSGGENQNEIADNQVAGPSRHSTHHNVIFRSPGNSHQQQDQAGGDEALQRQQQRQQRAQEEQGVKLGLGDFIFYSLLVGKASSYNDWTITLSCYVAILVGLSLTLTLLAVFRKALPALPISITFALVSFFMSYKFVVPFAENLTANQVFV